ARIALMSLRERRAMPRPPFLIPVPEYSVVMCLASMLLQGVRHRCQECLPQKCERRPDGAGVRLLRRLLLCLAPCGGLSLGCATRGGAGDGTRIKPGLNFVLAPRAGVGAEHSPRREVVVPDAALELGPRIDDAGASQVGEAKVSHGVLRVRLRNRAPNYATLC